MNLTLRPDPFMNRRPAPGKAFLCAAELYGLIHLYATGTAFMDSHSQTAKRSMRNLEERGYVKGGKLTESGTALCLRLIEETEA